MILLNGHSLERKDWFRVEIMALNLEERNSTATITIGPEAPEIAINDWLQDDTEPGKGIVWRVRTVTKNVETRTRTIQLEHIVQLLKDRVLFDEIKPDTITGNSSAEKCTAWEAADYIMRRQTEWRLGQIEGSRSAPYNFNGDTLFTALETVTGSLPDLQWEYDLRSMPFTLNIMRHPTGFQSEMRMRRNISTMRIQIDRTRMYTRLYPIGKNNLHISGNYVSKNERVWGRVDKVLTDQTRESEEDLLGWAQDNLNRHCEPLVTVTITGLELSANTGEPLDHIVVGRRCRVPIPKYGIWMTERVTKMSWGDKIKEPQKVTVTLANQLEDVASIINQQNTSTASSSASGRRGAKKNEEDHAWFVDTTDHVAMVAEAVAGEGAATDWSRVSEVLVDGQGIHQRVTYAEGEIVKQEARIDINEKRILQEVNDRTDADSTLSGRITTEAGRITAEVTRAKGQEEVLAGRLTITERAITQEVTDRTNADSTLSGRITTNANKVAIVVEEKNGQNVVKAASIVTAINDSESSIRLDADKVYIGNQKSTTVINGKLNASDVTAEYLSAKIATIPTLTGIAASFSGNVTSASGGLFRQVYVGSGTSWTNISDGLKEVQVSGPSGNTYTLQYKKFSDSSWQDAGNFSRAVASWTMGWSSGKFTAKANPQNQSCSTTLVQGTPSWDGNVVTIPVEAVDSDNPNYQYATGRSVVANAAARYNAGYVAGWNAARAKISRNGNVIMKPKARSGTDITTDVGTEAAYTATLNKGTAWGKAKSQYRINTPGGTGSWTGEKDYEVKGSYTINSTTTLEYRSTGGYWGWSTEPSISWS